MERCMPRTIWNYLDWIRLEAEIEYEEDIGEPLYDEDEEEEIDLLPVQGKNLAVQWVLSTPKMIEQEDWRWHSIFHTKVTCGAKVCDVIINNGCKENFVSKEAFKKLKLVTKNILDPTKSHG